MRSKNLKQIENIRKQIENLIIPDDKKKSKKNKKEKDVLISDKDKDKEKDINDNINKKFDELYDLFNNDKEYKKRLKEKERLDSMKISNTDSIYIKGKLNQEKIVKSKTLKFIDCIEILEKNEHQGRHEANFEDDFSSSDSYDSDLFTLNDKVPKNFKFKTKEDLKENEQNLLEIVRVLKAYQQ